MMLNYEYTDDRFPKMFKLYGETGMRLSEGFYGVLTEDENGIWLAIPNEVSKIIMDNTKVPIIGIGSGPNCDGQILVWHDLLGFDEKKRIFLKRYANLRNNITKALKQYKKEVIENDFPKDNNSFYMNKNEYEKLLKKIK